MAHPLSEDLKDTLLIRGLVALASTGRLLRLVRSKKGLEILFTTLLVSIPSIINVSILLMITMMIYASLGQNLLGRCVAVARGALERMFLKEPFTTPRVTSGIADSAHHRL